MSIKLNTILQHLKTTAALMPGMDADRVHLGPIFPSRVADGPHIVITETRVPGKEIDNNQTERTLVLEIGVAMRLDPGSTDDPDIQINTTYEPLHAELEKMCGGVANLFLAMEESADGPQSDLIGDEDVVVRYKSCGWSIQFERVLAATE